MQQLLRRTVNACRRTLNLTMADWDTRLTFVITPKSGPLRKMVRLRDVQQALIADLPSGFLRRAHWLKAGKALVTAAETGKSKDIEGVFEAVVAALDEEGWLPQGVSPAPPSCFEPLCVDPLRAIIPSIIRASVGNFAPTRPAEPIWRRMHPVGTNGQAAEGEQPASASLKRGPKDLETICPGAFSCSAGQ